MTGPSTPTMLPHFATATDTDLKPAPTSRPEVLDRLTILYLTGPLVIFLLGWLQLWIAIPLAAAVGYSLRGLLRRPGSATPTSFSNLQIAAAVAVGLTWTLLGGTGHLVFANADWQVRDAVLHDLVASDWPVAYASDSAKEALLRAPLGYYLPAALIGKLAGLPGAHVALTAWTALGVSMFLLQVLSLVPSRPAVVATVMLVLIFFSGLDFVGGFLEDGPYFLATWNIGSHIEWWTHRYQYSSMTTQLFWVPNHALCGWLSVGLLARNPGLSAVDPMLPILFAAVLMWSPLTAIGLLPFLLWRAINIAVRQRSLQCLQPSQWAPALLVGIAVAGYLGMDPSGVPMSWTLGATSHIYSALMLHAEFFLLEAGLIGLAILAIGRSSEVVVALVILALLPLVTLGAANDFVMRASIPSLVVLAIGACVALSRTTRSARETGARLALGCLLLVGAVTAVQEFARVILLPAWPIDMQTTLIGAACGQYPAHYIAHLGTGSARYLLRTPHELAVEPRKAGRCINPAMRLMDQAGMRYR